MDAGLTIGEQLKLGLTSTYYSVARALRLRKLRDLLQSAQIATDHAVWLLGECYGESGEGALHEEALTQLVLHFQSIVWMTYRTHFTPIGVPGAAAAGDVHLRSDAGWGCTLRSGQMVLAQALQRHRLGRGWRWPVCASGGGHETVLQAAAAAVPALAADAEPPEDLRWLLQLFWDAPSERNPLSIHNLCSYGKPCGVHPGKWLGPWVMCHALAAAAAHSPQPLGLRVAVLADPGGGAPLLSIRRFEAHFTAGIEGAGGAAAVAEPWQLLGEGREVPCPQQEGLLLLVPLVLGLGKLNPVYIPQLQAVLRLPQSVGIVGGRPSSSLYFVGYQGECVIYLDPHDVQQAACSDGDWQSFHCDVLRSMPLPSIDPSLALGFYCRDLGEFLDLCGRLAELERQAGGAPLLCVTEEDVSQQYNSGGEPQWEPDEMSEGDGEGEGGSQGCMDEGGGVEAGFAPGVAAVTAAPGAAMGSEQGSMGAREGPFQDLSKFAADERPMAGGQGTSMSPSQQQAGGSLGADGGPAAESSVQPLSPATRLASARSGWELL